MSSDRIEKKTLLAAPIERVWQAISDAGQFGHWFGAAFDGPFVSGARITGRIVPTQVDPNVARLQQPHAGKPFEWWIERMDPPRRLAFRWHPGAPEPGRDDAPEATTLVTFELEPLGGGTLLTIPASGFDAIPLERRAATFTGNDAGWSHQLRLIEQYVGAP